MKQVTLNIPDNKYGFFIELMQSLNFIDSPIENIEIPEKHKEIVRKRIKKMEANPESYMTWEDIEQKIKL